MITILLGAELSSTIFYVCPLSISHAVAVSIFMGKQSKFFDLILTSTSSNPHDVKLFNLQLLLTNAKLHKTF